MSISEPKNDRTIGGYVLVTLFLFSVAGVLLLSSSIAGSVAQDGAIRNLDTNNEGSRGSENAVSSRAGAQTLEAAELNVTVSAEYQPEGFEDLIAVVPYNAPSVLPGQTPDVWKGVELVRRTDGRVVAQIEVAGDASSLLARLRPSAGQLLISIGRTVGAESILWVLDGRRDFEVQHRVSLPGRASYKVYMTSGFALSANEQYLYYHIHEVDRTPACTEFKPPPAAPPPASCEIMLVGILDLDQLKPGSSAQDLQKVPLPSGCGSPVIVPTAETQAVASCRRSQDVFLIDPTGSILQSEQLGVMEWANAFAQAGPANAFGFRKGDGSLGVVTWRGTLVYHGDDGDVVEASLLPEGLRLATGMGSPYLLGDGRILLGVERVPGPNDLWPEEMGRAIIFDPESLAVDGEVETGQVRGLVPMDGDLLVSRPDGSVDLVDPDGETVQTIVLPRPMEAGANHRVFR